MSSPPIKPLSPIIIIIIIIVIIDSSLEKFVPHHNNLCYYKNKQIKVCLNAII